MPEPTSKRAKRAEMACEATQNGRAIHWRGAVHARADIKASEASGDGVRGNSYGRAIHWRGAVHAGADIKASEASGDGVRGNSYGRAIHWRGAVHARADIKASEASGDGVRGNSDEGLAAQLRAVVAQFGERGDTTQLHDRAQLI